MGPLGYVYTGIAIGVALSWWIPTKPTFPIVLLYCLVAIAVWALERVLEFE